ncbi:MAG: hypothetical protein KAJ14_10630 [Candidatus Omnitrophica bacterium]|nr:hypothetical protein [Candidatus Omnitrophota bacterium]
MPRNGYTNLSGYVLYNKKYKDAGGYFILPEDVLGPINNTFFDILSEAGIEVRLVSENEKKKHVAKNAHGRKSKLGANEKQVSFDMQESNQEYADTPQMRTVEITDQVVEWLDNPWVDFILANLLSSDMMKHTGNYQSALKGNKITDENLGRIIRKVNRISKPIIREIEKEISEATREFPDIVDKIGVYKAAEFLEIKGWFAVAERIRKMAAKAPILVLSADHGASEDGLKAKVQESTTAHTANPVPYIIYDLLNPRITLQEGRTIRNNAATLLHLMGMDIPDEYESSLIDNSYKGQPRRIVNLILDGWGINPDPDYEFNAIKNSKPENYNWLVENASFVSVAAHGEVIGLRKNLSPFKKDHHSHDLQPGATDIGHFSHFAGRLKKQAIVKVDEFINGELSTGIFDANNEKLQPIVKKMKRIIKEGKKFHHIAVGSEGGVHSCLSHMFALMRMAKALGMEKDQFVIHFIADGRDVGPITADLFLSDVYEVIEEAGIGVVGTFFGRTDLVRKDGFEHITNRIISILEGDVKKFTVNSIKKYTITSEQASENEAAAQLTQDGTQIDPENSLDKDAHLSLKTSI